MKRYLEYYENEWPENISELTAIENKPFVGYLKGGGMKYTIIPKPGPADNEIWYTSTDGNVVNFNVPSPESGYPDTAYTVLSNEYINGRGVITCKEKITIMPGNAFTYSSHFDEERCEFINSITLPECCEGIEHCACYGLTSLNSISIPNSIRSIGDNAFLGCYFTKEHFINNSSLDAEANNYWGAEIADVEINGLLIRNDTAIYCRPYVTSIAIPNNVTSIGDRAFSGCSSLTSIVIPDGVTSIGKYAFEGCSSLNSVTIPESVTSIGDNAFLGCAALESIVVESSNTIYDSRDNCNAIIKTATNKLILGSQNTIIPNSVTCIEDNAFYYTDIYNDESNWENGVLYINNCLIDAKTNITSTYTIKNGTRLIADSAFQSCSSLNTITIPESVTSIGESAFRYCPSLYTIIFEGTVEQWNAITKGDDWNYNISAIYARCSDGRVTL